MIINWYPNLDFLDIIISISEPAEGPADSKEPVDLSSEDQENVQDTGR